MYIYTQVTVFGCNVKCIQTGCFGLNQNSLKMTEFELVTKYFLMVALCNYIQSRFALIILQFHQTRRDRSSSWMIRVRPNYSIDFRSPDRTTEKNDWQVMNLTDMSLWKSMPFWYSIEKGGEKETETRVSSGFEGQRRQPTVRRTVEKAQGLRSE